MPANTTSLLQPLDQGIIQTVKQLYRKILVKSVVSNIYSEEAASVESIAKSVNNLEAVQWLASCVKEEKVVTLTRCFVKAGIVLPDTDSEDEDDDDKIHLAELVELTRAASDQLCNEC